MASLGFLLLALALVAVAAGSSRSVDLAVCLPGCECAAEQAATLRASLLKSDTVASAVLVGPTKAHLDYTWQLVGQAFNFVTEVDVSKVIQSVEPQLRRAEISKKVRRALQVSPVSHLIVILGLEKLKTSSIAVLDVFMKPLDTTWLAVSDPPIAPDGLGELSSSRAAFLFVFETSVSGGAGAAESVGACVPACSHPAVVCDARKYLLDLWQGQSKVGAFNPTAFLGRINQVVALPALNEAQVAALVTLKSTNLECFDKSFSPNVVVAALTSNWVYSYFSRAYDIRCPASVALYAVPTVAGDPHVAAADAMLSILSCPYPVWLVLMALTVYALAYGMCFREGGERTSLGAEDVQEVRGSGAEFEKQLHSLAGSKLFFPKSPVSTHGQSGFTNPEEDNDVTLPASASAPASSSTAVPLAKGRPRRSLGASASVSAVLGGSARKRSKSAGRKSTD